MKFRVVRESEFEVKPPSTANPLRGTEYAQQIVQSEEYPTAWLIQVADLDALRQLCVEIAQIENGSEQGPSVVIDFLPHYAETPADCDGILILQDL